MNVTKTEKTRAIANQFLNNLQNGEATKIKEMFEGKDSGWQVMGSNKDFPFARKYAPNELDTLFAAQRPAAAKGGKIDILGIFADGDRAFIEIHAQGISATDDVYDNYILFSIETGEKGILLLKEYLDTRHIHKLLSDAATLKK